MAKKFYEVVVEGHYDFINGMLEGFLLGKGKNWVFYFSRKAGIKAETLSEKIAEWITFRTKIHHLVIEDKFYDDFTKAMQAKSNHTHIHKKFIKSAKKIKKASFEFSFKTYGKKYGDEIKALLKKIPTGVKLQNYKPKETVLESGKGIEQYAPEHEYAFEGSGKLVGELDGLLTLRKKLEENPLIELKEIVLNL
jgi:hypothetical protein